MHLRVAAIMARSSDFVRLIQWWRNLPRCSGLRLGEGKELSRSWSPIWIAMANWC